MATFRRSSAKGATWFFTAVTQDRQPVLTHPDVLLAVKNAMHRVRKSHPFQVLAWATLPGHIHTVWRLPEGDAAYSIRWALIKRHTAQASRHLVTVSLPESARKRGEIGLWQRRYWEHQIRDEADLRRHVDYVHYNPVKHGLVTRAADWPYSTFSRYVERGLLPEDWGMAAPPADNGRFGE